MSNPAETYESYMVPPLFAPAARRLVDAAGPQPGERVLDVACGTGVVARHVAPRVGPEGEVVGLDLNPDMLAVARAAAAREGLSVDWREGRAEALSFPDGGFNLVLCQFGLMFFADRQAAVAEMYRVLTDGGRVVLSVWQGLERHPFYRTLHEVIERQLGMSSLQDIFALGDADELRTLLRSAGFRDVEIEPVSLTARFPDPEGFLAGEIDVDTAAIPAMQHLDAAARREMTATIRGQMEGPLRAVTDGDHVVIPFHAHVARGHR
jgi:ubiquinone/menaquinone biosynthesis C-methylase UbiE